MRTGLVIDPADENQLAEALLYLLANDGRAKLMGEEGYKRVMNYFSSTKMAQRYVTVYSEVSEERRKKR